MILIFALGQRLCVFFIVHKITLLKKKLKKNCMHSFFMHNFIGNLTLECNFGISNNLYLL